MTSVTLTGSPASRGRLQTFYRALRSNPSAAIGLILGVLYAVIFLAGPSAAPHPYDQMRVGPPLEGPSRDHPFGTDEFGRDVYSRVLRGAPISLRVGALVVLIAGGVGSVIGLACGFVGGWFDEIVMRATDIFLAFPGLVMALIVASALGASIESAIIGIALVRWTGYARLMRSCVLAEKAKDYVLAGRALGVRSLRLAWKHVLPNSYAPMLVQSTLDFGLAILLAAGLSFIGAGAQPPLPEWGALVAGGRQYVQAAWWIPVFPGLAIFGAVLAFNLLGDGLRDALDPRLRDEMQRRG
jgi:peptide/nickel transport system permease protein